MAESELVQRGDDLVAETQLPKSPVGGGDVILGDGSRIQHAGIVIESNGRQRAECDTVRPMQPESRFELAVGSDDRLACRWSRPAFASPATVVYVHGFGSSQKGEKAEFFRRRCLAFGFDFLSFDLRGHGSSSGAMLDLTLTRCLEDLAAVGAFLDSESRRRRILLGSSMGGLVGLWHAAREPDALVAGLFIAPAVGLAEDFADRLGEEGMTRWREEGALAVVNELGSFEVGWQLAVDLERYSSARLAELHRVPSLVFQGRLDDRVAWKRVADFCEVAGDAARLRLFADGDHRLLERRFEIWDEMRSFLGERLRAPAARRRPGRATLNSGEP